MQRRLGLALSLSLVLIAFATWFRFSHSVRVSGENLTVINSKSATDSTTIVDALLPATTTRAISSSDEKLTDTDLVVRQLFSDYVSLSANGQATQATLDSLGDKYASSIASLNKAETVFISDLKITGNSTETLTAYMKSLSAIYNKYHALLAAQPVKGKDYTIFGPDLILLTKNYAKVYQDESTALRALPVPVAVSEDHLKLINLYLKRAWNMRAIANSDDDPADATAAIASESDMINDEQNLFLDIQKILNSNGIMTTNQ